MHIVSYRTEYFNLIEECVSQIVLHKSGVDPDFATKRFQIDVDSLIGQLYFKIVRNNNSDWLISWFEVVTVNE